MASSEPIHVVMVPWVAFGHMIPFLQLSIALAKAGLHVSFISTPKNIRRLPLIPPKVAPFIDLVGLPLPLLEDTSLLPEGAEASIDVPFDKMQYLNIAFDLLKHPFKQFVIDQSPDYIISDFNPYWTAEVALELNIPFLTFSAFSAATKVFFGPPEYLAGDGFIRVRSKPESLTTAPEWIDFPSPVAFREYEAPFVLGGFYGKDASGVSGAERSAKALSACKALAIRSCNEIEGEYLSLMEKLIGKPVIPVGLLPPEKPTEQKKENGIENGGPWTQVFKWLDQQNPKSVVFVGFGSECKLSKEQAYEIAYGLEQSELPFLWAFRKPTWAVDDLDALPPGFADRTSGKGMVCFGWAPQMEILAHPSIGGALFHAGWGSVIEILQFGHVLIVLPFIIDQPLNAKLLVHKGLAIEVERNDQDGSFSRDGIVKSLRFAMASKGEGEKLRVRVREMGKMFENQELHQDYYIGRFVDYLKNEIGNLK